MKEEREEIQLFLRPCNSMCFFRIESLSVMMALLPGKDCTIQHGKDVVANFVHRSNTINTFSDPFLSREELPRTGFNTIPISVGFLEIS